MRSDPTIHVVIPVHDRRELTRSCLQALRRQTHPGLQVVVVDDGSTDGTWEMLKTDFPEVVSLRGRGDLWWTGATNLGCGWVLAHTDEMDGAVVTLNDDTDPGPGWLAALVSAARQRPGALIGSLVVDADSGRVVHAGQLVDWWTAKYRAPLQGLTPNEVQSQAGSFAPADFLCGTGTIIPLRALRELGPFDPSLPQYAADYELSHRAAVHGFPLLVSTDAVLALHSSETGLRSRRTESLALLLRSLWSVRSSTGWRYRVRFALRACPRAALPSYLVCDAMRVLGGTTRDYIAERVG